MYTAHTLQPDAPVADPSGDQRRRLGIDYFLAIYTHGMYNYKCKHVCHCIYVVSGIYVRRSRSTVILMNALTHLSTPYYILSMLYIHSIIIHTIL